MNQLILEATTWLPKTRKPTSARPPPLDPDAWRSDPADDDDHSPSWRRRRKTLDRLTFFDQGVAVHVPDWPTRITIPLRSHAVARSDLSSSSEMFSIFLSTGREERWVEGRDRWWWWREREREREGLSPGSPIPSHGCIRSQQLSLPPHHSSPKDFFFLYIREREREITTQVRIGWGPVIWGVARGFPSPTSFESVRPTRSHGCGDGNL